MDFLEIKKLLYDAIAKVDLASKELNDDFHSKELKQISSRLFEIVYDL